MEPENKNILAVIIPAYKPTFFEKTLCSLAQQTNKNFIVYIGDDCSPYDLQSICDKFKNRLNIHYHRFQNNIGAKHLVHQWKRCVNLMQDEKWIWLFSDDDIADENCVEIFYKTIAADNNSFDVYRFDTRIINKNDEIVEVLPESPFTESSFDMAIEILKFNRGNSIVDHIFSKGVYNKYNGFVYTDYAQGADWATSILLSTHKGVCTMPGAKVNWRLSDENLSGKAWASQQMIEGHLQFLAWIANHFYGLKHDKPKYRIFQNNADFNMNKVMSSHYKRVPLRLFANVLSCYASYHNFLTAFFLTVGLYQRVEIPKLFISTKHRLRIKLGAMRKAIGLSKSVKTHA